MKDLPVKGLTSGMSKMSSAIHPLFLRVLIRQARAAAPDPDTTGQKAFLTALITGQFEAVQDGHQSLISSTINGKSITFSVNPGYTKVDVMMAAELALEYLEAGIAPTTEVYARF